MRVMPRVCPIWHLRPHGSVGSGRLQFSAGQDLVGRVLSEW
jgi:hypothetical protein